MALIEAQWLKESFVTKKAPLVRRQDLPPGALCSETDAKEAVEKKFGAHPISYGWLAPGNPDPASLRRRDIKAIMDNSASFGGATRLFWDYASLHQPPRSAAEGVSFREALDHMHLAYSNSEWVVIRLLDVPSEGSTTPPTRSEGGASLSPPSLQWEQRRSSRSRTASSSRARRPRCL